MRPAPGLLLALLVCAALGVPVLLDLLPPTAPLAGLLALAVLALIDAMRVRRTASPGVERDLPRVLPVDVERAVRIRLRNPCNHRLALELHDMHPQGWSVRDLPRAVALPPGREVELSYRVQPRLRGEFSLDGCMIRLRSAWGLWEQRRTLDCAQTVRVFPNFAPLAGLALVGAEQASRVIGAHLRRRRGEGTEFHQLREYRIGDSMRQIDWKASQRARRLISREYQDERNQQVLLLLDGGRRMLARDDGLAHFDHALNAALVLAHIALRQGDAVGLMTTGGARRHLPPQRGLGTIDRLLDITFDLQAQPVATDYLDAATQVGIRQSRRALVVLLTNLRDEDVDDLAVAVHQLQRRHLVCVASLREQVLDQARRVEVDTFQDALLLGATEHYLEARRRAHEMLRLRGVDVLDVTCAQLPSALVEHYLSVKQAARL